MQNSFSEELVSINQSKHAPLERKRLYVRTFGCQMNEYDSEKLRRILESRYESVDSPEKADLILINTCSVRDKPEQKLYSLLGEFRELKSQNPALLIGVGGCVAQQEGAAIVKRNKAVDFVFGTHNLSLVPSLIDRRVAGADPQIAVDYRDEWEDLPLGLSGAGRVSVFVAISRGCNKNCSYCIVPTTRGREVSRSAEEIEREIRIAVHRGAREVVLLGQTVNSWGLDLTPRRKFGELLNRVSEIPGLARIRFTSPHPQEVRDDFIDLIATNPKICRHVHMPLQSGSDMILRAMNRNYRRKRYLDIISALASRVPDLAITTDIIVGFPGESERDFLDTLDVLEQVRYHDSYSFMYSPRPGTAAAEMEGQIPEELKLERLQRFQARQFEITSEILTNWVGREVEVLVDGPSRYSSTVLHGRTSQNISFNFENPTFADGRDINPGDIVKAVVDEAARFTLRGRALAPAFPAAPVRSVFDRA